MKATIIDVATQAGVSVATVSRVVNGNYPVREETRLKVLRAIDELHYVPNLQARELNLQRSSTIGVIVPSLYNMFFAEVIDGIEEHLQRDAYSLLLCCAKNDPRQEEKCVRDLMARNVSGIIVISPNTQDIAADFYERMGWQLPMVFVNSRARIENISYVANEEGAGVRLALGHLFSLGHRRILFVCGVNSDSYKIKEEAYAACMREQGCFRPEFIVNIGDGNGTDTVDNTAACVPEALQLTDATAVLACNDLMALGAVTACRKMGYRVPEDISVIGYDNIALSHIVEPKLTTVDQNMKTLGGEAAKLLIEKVENGRSQSVLLDNHLIKRATTARVRPAESKKTRASKNKCVKDIEITNFM